MLPTAASLVAASRSGPACGAVGRMALSQVTPTLFLGGAEAALNGGLLARKGITLVVNATLLHPRPPHRGLDFLRVPVPDLPGAPLGDHFERVAQRIHDNRPGGTLVHCAVGVSRSPALVMAYLMRFRGVTLQQAHRWVRDSRPGVRLNAGFWEQLLLYERRLYGKNSVRVAPAPPPAPAAVSAPRGRRSTQVKSPPMTWPNESPRPSRWASSL